MPCQECLCCLCICSDAYARQYLTKKQLEHDGINITVLAHAHFILKKSSLQSFMELVGCLQQELEPRQLWLDIAGESYGSSFEFDGFVLDMEKQEPMPRAGSLRGRQPVEKKSDQHSAQSDGGAGSKSVKSDQCSAQSDGTRSKTRKSDRGQILKKEGKNLAYLHKDTNPSRSRRASSVSRSGKSPSRNTCDDVQLYRPRPSPSPGSRDLGPASGLMTPVALVQKWPTGIPLCQ